MVFLKPFPRLTAKLLTSTASGNHSRVCFLLTLCKCSVDKYRAKQGPPCICFQQNDVFLLTWSRPYKVFRKTGQTLHNASNVSSVFCIDNYIIILSRQFTIKYSLNFDYSVFSCTLNCLKRACTLGISLSIFTSSMLHVKRK